MQNRVRLSLRGEKTIVNQNPVIQTVVHTQICTIPKFSKKEYSLNQLPNSDWLFDQQQLIMRSNFVQVAIWYRQQFRAIQGLFSAQGLLHYSDDKLESFLQLISNEVSDYIPYQTSYGYVSKFFNQETFNFCEVHNFSPRTGVFR